MPASLTLTPLQRGSVQAHCTRLWPQLQTPCGTCPTHWCALTAALPSIPMLRAPVFGHHLSCHQAHAHGCAVQDIQGYWRTQKEIVADVWAVVNGPERRAVRLALMIAFLDQGMASTAIVNYAPQVHPSRACVPAA